MEVKAKDIFTSHEIDLIRQAGNEADEETTYTKEDLQKLATNSEEYILSHSSKGKLIQSLNNEYATIFSKVTRIIDRT